MGTVDSKAAIAADLDRLKAANLADDDTAVFESLLEAPYALAVSDGPRGAPRAVWELV